MRFFKKKLDVDPHRYYFSELILYHPFRDENDLYPEDPVKCQELYLKHADQIKYTKAQVMPFLESVHDAQLIYDEMKANEEQDERSHGQHIVANTPRLHQCSKPSKNISQRMSVLS